MAALGPDLVGSVARLSRVPGARKERILVVSVEDLGDGLALILGDLLYLPGGAYGPRDSRGRFSSVGYRIGDDVEVEA